MDRVLPADLDLYGYVLNTKHLHNIYTTPAGWSNIG